MVQAHTGPKVFTATFGLDYRYLVLHGFSATQRIWIVSERHEDIRKYIVEHLGRGATLFEGRGGFTDERRHVVITYVPRRMVSRLMRDLHEMDPMVFMAVDSAAQVYGEGFRSFKNP